MVVLGGFDRGILMAELEDRFRGKRRVEGWMERRRVGSTVTDVIEAGSLCC